LINNNGWAKKQQKKNPEKKKKETRGPENGSLRRGGRSRLYLLALLIDKAYCFTWNYISNSLLFPSQRTLRTDPELEYLFAWMVCYD
jgi:hypothetical protein